MNSAGNDEHQSPVTARAVCLGLAFSILIDLVQAYNDDVLYNSLIVGNHFPLISIVVVMLLILGVNVGAARWLGIRGLSSGELLLIWGMIGVAGGIAGSGLMRYLAPWVAAPAYYSSAGNEWNNYVLKYLPPWMLLSKDTGDHAVKWFMEGLPRGERIPWGAWAVPLAAWGGFTLLLYATNFCFVSLFYRQWAVRERLVFPVVHLPAVLAEEPSGADRFNNFLSNRWMWIGCGGAALMWGFNGLSTYFPQSPRIPTAFIAPLLSSDRPWSEFQLANLNISFIVIGITFLLTSEIAFSLWASYVLYRLSYVYVAWLGSGATGFWGEWETRVGIFETAGGMLAIAVFLAWTARGFLADWLGRLVSGTLDAEQDPIPPRWALAIMALGFGGMCAWSVLGGAQWWAAVAAIVLFLAVLLVLTRIIAEAGLIFIQTSVIPYDVLAGLLPPGWLAGGTLNVLNMQRAILMQDLRESLMPYVMNGVNAGHRARMHLGKVMAALALAAVVGLGVSAYSRISTGYRYGAVNMDQWSAIWSPPMYMGGVADYQKNPPEFAFVRLGERPLLPVNVAHLLTGGALASVMLALRSRFLWWPLHPFGFVLCASWAMSVIWFPIFVGWAAKTLVMTFGSSTVYRRVLPVFLGMALGEALAVAFWIIVGLATGSPAGVALLR